MNGSISTVGLSLLLWLHGGILHAEQSDRDKSVTVYPVVISPSNNIAASIPQRIAEVVGLQLERAGMERIEMGDRNVFAAGHQGCDRTECGVRTVCRPIESPDGVRCVCPNSWTTWSRDQ